jgi:hypothetical protein
MPQHITPKISVNYVPKSRQLEAKSLFSIRHYVFLASVCRDMRHNVAETTTSLIARESVDAMIGELVAALESENPSFDRKRFLLAVYGE